MSGQSETDDATEPAPSTTPNDTPGIGDTTGPAPTGQLFPAGGLTGWVCPRCGAGNSPLSMRCDCVPMPAPVITVTCAGALALTGTAWNLTG